MTNFPLYRNEENHNFVLLIEVIRNVRVQSVEYSSRGWLPSGTCNISCSLKKKIEENKNNLSLSIRKLEPAVLSYTFKILSAV